MDFEGQDPLGWQRAGKYRGGQIWGGLKSHILGSIYIYIKVDPRIGVSGPPDLDLGGGSKTAKIEGRTPQKTPSQKVRFWTGKPKSSLTFALKPGYVYAWV